MLRAFALLPLQSAFELLVVSFAIITQFADVWFLVVGLSLLYWIGPRYVEKARPVAAVTVGFALFGLSVVLAIKSFTAAPRPPGIPIDTVSLPAIVGLFVADVTDASGFSFPSGHAVGATVVYGGLGLLLTVGRRWVRYALAASAILLISLSRVVLRVHYPTDVLAGIGIGAVLLAVGVIVAIDDEGYRPDRVFVLAAVASVVGLTVALWADHPREVQQGALAVGTTVGGFVTWNAFGEKLRIAPPVSLPVALVGLAVAGSLWIGSYLGVFPLIAAIIASTLGGVVILALPLVSARRQKKTVRDREAA